MSIAIERIEAKRKLSGNRSAADRAGVRHGLARTVHASPRLRRAMTPEDTHLADR